MMSLSSVLDAREARWKTRTELAGKWNRSVLSLSMVVPGPRKNAPSLEKAVYLMADAVETTIPLRERTIIEGADGISLHWVSDLEPYRLKLVAIEIEEKHPLGRLVDLDVMDSSCVQIGRSDFGFSPRKCLICDRPARLCSAERSHSIGDLTDALSGILRSCGCLAEGDILFEE